MVKIIYVGHTLTHEQVAGITSGWSDTELTDEGVRKARHMVLADKVETYRTFTLA